MAGRPNNLFLVPGGAIDWTDELLSALERCIRQEMPASRTARHLGVHPHTLGRGCMILCRRMMLERRL